LYIQINYSRDVDIISECEYVFVVFYV